MLKRLTQDFLVYAAAPYITEGTKSKLREIGVNCISNEFERTGLNPLKDFKAYLKFRKQVKELAPDIVLAYTIKPVIFGLMASKIRGSKRFALITGKGSGFDQTNLKSKIVRAIVKLLYKKSLSSVDGIIFQNQEDEYFFRQQGLLVESARSTVIKGTGVDLDYYKSRIELTSESKVKFLFIARLIKEKGIPELFEAAQALREKHSNFEVQLLGWIDPNPGGISKEEIEEMHQSGVINYLGTTDDVRPFIDKADVFVLPSYYNEGLPRTIQEAMAMKMPVITTDHPGCRETVEDGRNGFLIPIKDPGALIRSMEYFIQNPEAIGRMGNESRLMAIDRFDVHKINEQLLNFMRLEDV